MSHETMLQQHEDLSVEKAEAFARQQEIMNRIKAEGFSAYAEKLPNISDAFDLSKNQKNGFERCVCCMDEGTCHGLHAAGSLILLSDEALEDYIKTAGPDAITSHDGCGAGKLYCRKHGLPEDNSDAIARARIEEIAEKYGLAHEHISASEMNRPEFHDARVCYYDGTGEFNYAGVEGLPKGFVVSRAFLGKETSLVETGVACNIIFGDHGLGDNLTEDAPFVLVPLAKDPESLQQLQDELAGLPHSYGSRVMIDKGLIRPDKKE